MKYVKEWKREYRRNIHVFKYRDGDIFFYLLMILSLIAVYNDKYLAAIFFVLWIIWYEIIRWHAFLDKKFRTNNTNEF